MKNSIKTFAAFLVFISVLSCSNDFKDLDATNKNLKGNFTQEKLESSSKLILTSNKISLKNAIELYKNDIDIELPKEELLNAKLYAFKGIMRLGLLEKGSFSDKEYFLKEQKELKSNIPVIKEVHQLLSDLIPEIGTDSIMVLVKEFKLKNENYIDSLNLNENSVAKYKRNIINENLKMKRLLVIQTRLN